MKKALIIGFGSIGKRHAHVLSYMGCLVAIVSQQINVSYKRYPRITDALSTHFDYIIIANATYLHEQSLFEILRSSFSGPILVEKPLFSQPHQFECDNANSVFVGYNLRFHPVLQYLKKILQGEEIISFHVRVGQYLPTWRPQIDYRNSCSAKKDEGGGVLRDLSHELDYATWICGDCISVAAIGGKLSALEIDSDDTYSILMKCQWVPVVMIHMDYLSRIKKREIIVQTKRNTIVADLIQNRVSINEVEEKFESVDTYMQQHIAILSQNFQQLCSYSQGLKIIKLIDLIEQANLKKEWMLI